MDTFTKLFERPWTTCSSAAVCSWRCCRATPRRARRAQEAHPSVAVVENSATGPTATDARIGSPAATTIIITVVKKQRFDLKLSHA